MDVRFSINLFALLLNVYGVMCTKSDEDKNWLDRRIDKVLTSEVVNVTFYCYYDDGCNNLNFTFSNPEDKDAIDSIKLIRRKDDGRHLSLFFLDLNDHFSDKFAREWHTASGRNVIFVQSAVQTSNFIPSVNYNTSKHITKVAKYTTILITKIVDSVKKVDASGYRFGGNLAAEFAYCLTDHFNVESGQKINKLIVIDPVELKLKFKKGYIDKYAAAFVQIISTTSERNLHLVGDVRIFVKCKSLTKNLAMAIFMATATRKVAFMAGLHDGMADTGRMVVIDGDVMPWKLNEVQVGIYGSMYDACNGRTDYVLTMNEEMLRTIGALIEPEKVPQLKRATSIARMTDIPQPDPNPKRERTMSLTGESRVTAVESRTTQI